MVLSLNDGTNRKMFLGCVPPYFPTLFVTNHTCPLVHNFWDRPLSHLPLIAKKCARDEAAVLVVKIVENEMEK